MNSKMQPYSSRPISYVHLQQQQRNDASAVTHNYQLTLNQNRLIQYKSFNYLLFISINQAFRLKERLIVLHRFIVKSLSKQNSHNKLRSCSFIRTPIQLFLFLYSFKMCMNLHRRRLKSTFYQLNKNKT